MCEKTCCEFMIWTLRFRDENTLLTIAARLGATERVENAVTARLDAVTRRVVIDGILTRIIISNHAIDREIHEHSTILEREGTEELQIFLIALPNRYEERTMSITPTKEIEDGDGGGGVIFVGLAMCVRCRRVDDGWLWWSSTIDDDDDDGCAQRSMRVNILIPTWNRTHRKILTLVATWQTRGGSKENEKGEKE